MNPAVALFAKPPIPGRVKTRLVPPLTPGEAASLYAAFLADLAGILSAGRAWDWFCYSPDPRLQESLWPRGAARPAAWREQRGNDLGARLTAALRECLDEGRPKAVVVGSDHPTLDPGRLVQALDALDRVDLVLGPTGDGGYYLAGLSRPPGSLFEDVPWSTSRVLEATLAGAAGLGYRTVLLPPWYDVDTAGDLARLRRDLETTGRAPRTRAALEVPPAEC